MRLPKASAHRPHECTALFVVNSVKLHLTVSNKIICVKSGHAIALYVVALTYSFAFAVSLLHRTVLGERPHPYRTGKNI